MPTDVLTDSLININGDNVQTLEILILTTLIAVLPSMLVMMNSFNGAAARSKNSSAPISCSRYGCHASVSI